MYINNVFSEPHAAVVTEKNFFRVARTLPNSFSVSSVIVYLLVNIMTKQYRYNNIFCLFIFVIATNVALCITRLKSQTKKNIYHITLYHYFSVFLYVSHTVKLIFIKLSTMYSNVINYNIR